MLMYVQPSAILPTWTTCHEHLFGSQTTSINGFGMRFFRVKSLSIVVPNATGQYERQVRNNACGASMTGTSTTITEKK